MAGKKSTKSPKKKYRCKLPKFEVTECLTLEEAKQKSGWGITAFQLPEAWKLTQGEGVKIAILDTGVDIHHQDLVNNLLPGVNLVNPGREPIDGGKHGTHCAGIIIAENNEIGMVGVAPKAQVIPIKVLNDNGSGDFLVVAQGIRKAVELGADIISMSLGSPFPVQEVRKAVQFADSNGVPVFCAAGNAGRTQEVFYPAAYPETIAIGSIDENFDRSSFSNTGQDLDFMAPGGKVFSTVPENWYAELSGTSMACPFAVGVAALLLSYVRQKKINIPLKCAADYRAALRKHTTSVNDPNFAGKKFFEGFGIIDPRKMVEWCKNNA